MIFIVSSPTNTSRLAKDPTIGARPTQVKALRALGRAGYVYANEDQLSRFLLTAYVDMSDVGVSGNIVHACFSSPGVRRGGGTAHACAGVTGAIDYAYPSPPGVQMGSAPLPGA
ncbi:MAG: hypothetical protein OTJ97_08630 [SAR202 cluster bacterium]|nr:hypothetical protein [SAR202 cluster bacterium]